MSVLATGFEPFGKHEVNPSQLVAQELGGVVLPVSYARAAEELRAAIREHEPDVVVCFGLADDREEISVERFAHNLDEATTIDNDEAAGSGAEIDPAGPLAYRATLPVDAIVEALREAGIPAGISRDAGGFLCNHVFYVLMGALGKNQVGGFVHVPPLTVISESELVRAAHVIVEACEQRRSSS
jgi:pyroglutamyl-peptidase